MKKGIGFICVLFLIAYHTCLGADFVSRAFDLKYIQPEDARQPIKQMLSSDGKIETFTLPSQEGARQKSTGIIIVQDLPEVVEEVAKLIQSLDVERPLVKVTLNYADADLAEVLSSLSEDTQMNIVAGPNIQGKVNVRLVDVSLDNALNSILLSNGYTYIREGDILRIVPVGEAKGIEAPSLVTEVFILKYANAEDIKRSLEKFISKDGLMQTFSRSAVSLSPSLASDSAQAGPDYTSTSTYSGTSGTSYTSASTYSGTSGTSKKTRSSILIVKDKPEVLRNISQLIKELDLEPKQIWIEAKFVSVVLSDLDKLGIDWTIKATLTGSKVPSTLPFKNNRSSLDKDGSYIPRAVSTSTDFAVIEKIFPYAVKGDFAFGSLSFTDFKAVLEILQKNDKTKVISAPQVAALDGEEALINIGNDYPIPTYSLNQDTGQMVVTGYQTEKIGIVLRTTAHAVAGNKILLKLHPQVSEVSGFVGPDNERPIITTKELETTVTIANGETIVIGGLMKKEKRTYDHKVPFLGDIPVVGRAFFKYKKNTLDKTELLIFLTPHIANRGNPGEFHNSELASKTK